MFSHLSSREVRCHLLVARISNHEANIVGHGEFNTRDDVVHARHIDSELHVVSEETRLSFGGEGITALIREIGLHHRRRMIDTTLRLVLYILPCLGGTY